MIAAPHISPDDIRGLTLHRPWGWCFIHAGKRIENRPRRPPKALIGKYLALHEGQHFDRDALARMLHGDFGAAARRVPPLMSLHPSGVITSVVELAASYDMEIEDLPEGLRGDRFAFGPVCIHTPRVFPLREPVPCKPKCAQGYWRLPDEAFARVAAQLRGGVEAAGKDGR